MTKVICKSYTPICRKRLGWNISLKSHLKIIFKFHIYFDIYIKFPYIYENIYRMLSEITVEWRACGGCYSIRQVQHPSCSWAIVRYDGPVTDSDWGLADISQTWTSGNHKELRLHKTWPASLNGAETEPTAHSAMKLEATPPAPSVCNLADIYFSRVSHVRGELILLLRIYSSTTSMPQNGVNKPVIYRHHIHILVTPTWVPLSSRVHQGLSTIFLTSSSL